VLVTLASIAGLQAVPGEARRHEPTPQPTTTGVPMPVATPLSEGARMDRLHGELEAIAHDAPGRLGIAVIDLATDRRFTVRGDESFPLANTYRIAVAIAAYRLADQHKLDLDQRITVTRGDIRRGQSEIARAHPTGGATYAFWELVRAMLVGGDNTASDIVLRYVGGTDAVQLLLERLKVKGFTIRRSEANLAADARAPRVSASRVENASTPSAMADLLAGLSTQRYTLLDATNEILLHLGDVTSGQNRLRAGFPSSVRLAHEVGTTSSLDGSVEATNDAGLVTLPDGRRVAIVAFLAASSADEPTREATLARVGRAVASAFAP